MNLIALLQNYLILIFVLSIVWRYRQYQAMLGIVTDAKHRWPCLCKLVAEHRFIFLTWPTLLPIALTMALMLLHSIAYNLLWPQATVEFTDLFAHPILFIVVTVFCVWMVYLDMVAIFSKWEFQRADIDPYLDKAEYWLTTPWAPALRIFSFGFLNPRRMVREEVTKALTQACFDLNSMMWDWALQIAVRLAFGLSLWLPWAWYGFGGGHA
jgi:hypothetical protein